MKKWMFLLVIAALLAVAAIPAAAQQDPIASLSQAELQEKIQKLQQIQARNEERVLKIPGVVGIGIGLDRGRHHLCFIVYAEKLTSEIRSHLKAGIEEIPVRWVESGVIRAY